MVGKFREYKLDPKGKVALITGGARIGQVVAQALATRGCALALTYRDSRAAAEACAASARTAGVSTLVVHADATDEAQIRAAVQATAQTLGRLDILINMASTYIRTPAPSATKSALRTSGTKVCRARTKAGL